MMPHSVIENPTTSAPIVNNFPPAKPTVDLLQYTWKSTPWNRKALHALYAGQIFVGQVVKYKHENSWRASINTGPISSFLNARYETDELAKNALLKEVKLLIKEIKT